MKIGSIDNNAQVYVSKKTETDGGVENIKKAHEPVNPKNENAPVEQREKVSDEVLAKAVESANRAIGNMHAEVKFSIHEGTGEVCVKIIDKRNNEVIREIPSEKILDLVAKLWELAGIFVDERR